jgi:predicted Mrr-cat superfamily restriction endonuclease
MPRYWVMAPIEAHPSEVFEKVWQFDLANNLISLGFGKLGDVSKMNREEVLAAVAANYRDKPPATQSLIANMFWAFYHEMSPGDFVIARRGRKILAGVGRVTGQGVYSPGKSQFTDTRISSMSAGSRRRVIEHFRALSFPCTRSPN